MLTNLENSEVASWNWKNSVFISIPKKHNAKECSNYHKIALISHASKVMLKILQARLQQYMNQELLDVQSGFQRSWGTRDQIVNTRWIMEQPRTFQKNIYLYFIDYAKAFDFVDHSQTNWKSLNRWEYQTTLFVSWESCMWVKKQQLELGWEQQTGSKLGKEYNKAVYYHPVYLTSMYAKFQSGLITSWNQYGQEKYQ